MNTSCYAVNIRSTIDRNDNAYIGEEALNLLIDGFSCPPNLEVEHFLKHSALDFTKKNQSVTYLAFRPATHGDIFAGYYSLAIKPISVRASAISKTMEKKLARVSVLNPENDTFTASAYLIAQLGKNFALPKEKRISGKELLTFADLTIKMARHIVGGVVEFLECEDNPFLLDFYAENGFKAFDRRTVTPSDNESPHELVQLLRFL